MLDPVEPSDCMSRVWLRWDRPDAWHLRSKGGVHTLHCPLEQDTGSPEN